MRSSACVSEDLTKRFSELVRRELGASDVRLADQAEAEAEHAVSTALQDGRRLDAVFDGPIGDRDTMTRRLEILVRAFESVLFEDSEQPKRAPVAVSLQDELRALTVRSGAVDTLVIDAHSPVIWASAMKGATLPITVESSAFPAEAKETLRLVRESHRGVLRALSRPPADDSDDDFDSQAPPRSVTPPPQLVVVAPLDDPPGTPNERALAAVRRLPQIETLHRGGHLNQTVREADFGYLARSFAGIYALVVVFDAPFDEIRAERAVRDSLPRIERLVLALPPFDPEPLPAGVVALRPRRRR
jgi:hypothetical protein